MSLANALAQSINTIAVQVAERAGIRQVVATANRLGIASDLAPDASIALGTNEVNLLELVSAYAPFANGGAGVLAYGISEIRDSGGKILYRRTGSGAGQVVAPEFVGMMNEMLAGVIAYGTGKSAALPRPAAGKTGTTQDYRDAWFIGYTADLVAGVWLGNDDNSPMNKVTGGSLPAAAWHQFMLAATRGMPMRPLPGGAIADGPSAPPRTLAAPEPAFAVRPAARLAGAAAIGGAAVLPGRRGPLSRPDAAELMLHHIPALVAGFIVATISSGGYLGIVALMAIEFGVHTAAVGDHHAVLRLSGHRPGASISCWPPPPARSAAISARPSPILSAARGGRPFVESWGPIS